MKPPMKKKKKMDGRRKMGKKIHKGDSVKFMAAARPLPPATAAGELQQYLSSTLSDEGPEALPYPQESCSLILQHLAALSAAFPSLRPGTGLFTYNDGNDVNLLCAEGTVPISISISAKSCYLPLTIWLLESYPQIPPSVIVSFPPDMAAKPRHDHVDPSGAVCIPYLRTWSVPHHNLVDLVSSISRLFTQDPPFFVPYSRSPPPPSPGPSHRDIKMILIDRITEKFERDLNASRMLREEEMEKHFFLQTELEGRRQAIDGGLRQMEKELEVLKQQLQMVKKNSDVLESWLTDSRKNMQVMMIRSASNLVEPADEQSRQMAECMAADMAVEDTIYALDAAVLERCIPMDVYLKSVRALAREQFFHRAAAEKIRAARIARLT